MNPEEVQALLARIATAKEQGFSDAEINSWIRRAEDIPFPDLRTLQRHARAAGIAPAQEPAAEHEPSPLRMAAPFFQGVLGSLASDVLAGLEKTGIANEGEAERFRRDLQAAREEHPFLSAALQFAGMLVGGPRIATQKVLAPAARTAGSVAARAGQATAAKIGAGPLAQLGAREAARGVGATAAGGLLAGAEGAAIGFGEAAGKPIEDRLRSAQTSGVVSGLLGAPVSALTSGVRTVKTISAERAARGEVLARAAERVGQGLPSRRQVAARVARADAARRSAFDLAEAQGENIPGAISQLVITNPTIRGALARSRSQEARQFLRSVEEFRENQAALRQQAQRPARPAGFQPTGVGADPPPVRPLPAPRISERLADEIRKDLKFTVDAFARRMPDASGRVPSATQVREAQAALDALERQMRKIPGFDEGIQATRLARTQERALQQGRQYFNQPADVIEDLASGKSVRIGNRRVQVAKTDEAMAAFRGGLAIPVIQRLQGGASRAEGFLNELQTSTQLQRKMRTILGGDEPLRQFMQEANHLRAIGQAHKIVELLIKSAGFIGFGSSLFGGAAAAGLLGS